MATYVTLNPKKEIYMRTDDKFKRQVFVNNVMRIKEVILSVLDFVGFIKSCLEWEDVPRSVIAFIIFMTVTYYFEPYMAPIGLLLFFLKHFIVTRYYWNKEHYLKAHYSIIDILDKNIMLTMLLISMLVMMKMMKKKKKTKKRKNHLKKNYKPYKKLLLWFKMLLAMLLTFVKLSRTLLIFLCLFYPG